MEQLAYDIIDDMFSLAPQLTGDLAGSINWTWGDAPAGSLTLGSVGGGEQTRKYGAMQITIYAGNRDAFYARFQEFGTVNMAPNAFFFPVWRVWRRRISTRINGAIRKGLQEG